MKRVLLITTLMTMVHSSQVLAQDKETVSKGKAGEVSLEHRKEMASVHEKMAACLRSDRPMNECHNEMKTMCEAQMGGKECPMMGSMGGMKGHHHRMGDPAPQGKKK